VSEVSDLKVEPAMARPSNESRKNKIPIESLGLAAAVLIIIVLLSFTTDYFFSFENARNVSTAISFMGVAAAIGTLILIGGGVDLSVAAVMAVAGSTAAGLLDAGYSAYVAVIVALFVGLFVGLINGFLIASVGINPLITTIGTGFAVRGFAYIVIESRELNIGNETFLFVGRNDFLGFPLSFLIMIACFLGVGFVMKRTIFGQHIYAIGGTPDGRMAALAGVPVKRRTYQMYAAGGLVAALAGLVLATYSGSATGNAAMGLELPIIAAVILGGTALGGGRGTVTGTLLGVVLLGVINNGLTLRNVPYVWLFVVQGCVLLLAVVIDSRRERKDLK
jgi:ribose/xylose/arabinose/galactoside ABC-type transport system permease subunit